MMTLSQIERDIRAKQGALMEECFSSAATKQKAYDIINERVYEAYEPCEYYKNKRRYENGGVMSASNIRWTKDWEIRKPKRVNTQHKYKGRYGNAIEWVETGFKQRGAGERRFVDEMIDETETFAVNQFEEKIDEVLTEEYAEYLILELVGGMR